MSQGEDAAAAPARPGGAPLTPGRGWRQPAVLAAAGWAAMAGVAQFSVTAVIGDVAASFGTPGAGEGLTAQIGLTASTLGVALALVRLASLASLPATALADRLGRRRLLVAVATAGLLVTLGAAASPGFWWYVALAAVARPLLSTTNALAGILAAEETTSADRSAAIALVGAAYGAGAGLIAVLRGVLPMLESFRVVMVVAGVSVVLAPLMAARTREPMISEGREPATGLPGTLPAVHRRETAVLCLAAGAISVATGPGFTYLFVYGERVLGADPFVISVLVVAAGPVGLVGLLLGRRSADRHGRLRAAAVALALTGVSVGVGYQGTLIGLVIGYLGAIASSSAFAPPLGALTAELFPTSVRATVTGWLAAAGVLGAVVGLAAFGALADVFDSFGPAAAALGALAVVAAVTLRALPETRGLELDERTP